VHPAIFIFICPRSEPGEIRRLGLIFSRKLGGAVARNRLKRRLREIFRLHKHLLLPGIDMIFMPRPGAADLNYRQMESAVLGLWRKSGVLNEDSAAS
jgi:ribonuclease P protein component